MPTLEPELDGHVGAATSEWSSLLSADGGKVVDSTTAIASGTGDASSVNTTANAGGTAYRKREAFLAFDTSQITSTVSSAVLKLYIASATGVQQVRGYKGTFTGTVNVGYFNDFDLNTPYTNTQESQAGGYMSYALTADALTDLKNNSQWKIVMLDETYVAGAELPPNSTTLVTNYKFSEDTDHPPQLEYTLPDADPAGKIILTNRIQLTSGKIAL